MMLFLTDTRYLAGSSLPTSTQLHYVKKNWQSIVFHEKILSLTSGFCVESRHLRISISKLHPVTSTRTSLNPRPLSVIFASFCRPLCLNSFLSSWLFKREPLSSLSVFISPFFRSSLINSLSSSEEEAKSLKHWRRLLERRKKGIIN